MGAKPYEIAYRMSGGGEVTSRDKSVFFWTQQGLGYGYGEGFRGQNTPNLDKGILKADADFETSEQRDVLGSIAIHVGGLLISGNDMSVEYITHRMKENAKWITMRETKRSICEWKSLN